MEQLVSGGVWGIAQLIGAAIIINVIGTLAARVWRRRRTPQDLVEWTSELRRLLIDLMDADFHKAGLIAELATTWGNQPDGFNDMARDALARQLAVQPAIAAMAESMGLFEQGTFERMGMPAWTAPEARPNIVQRVHAAAAESLAPLPEVLRQPRLTTKWVGVVPVTVEVEKTNGAAQLTTN